MRFLIFSSILAFFLIAAMPGASQTSDNPTTINLLIKAGVPESATREEVIAEEVNIENVYNEINGRGLPATIFLTQDLVETRVSLILARIGAYSKFELAMSGNNSGEKLSAIPFDAQKKVLFAAKKMLKTAKSAELMRSLSRASRHSPSIRTRIPTKRLKI